MRAHATKTQLEKVNGRRPRKSTKTPSLAEIEALPSWAYTHMTSDEQATFPFRCTYPLADTSALFFLWECSRCYLLDARWQFLTRGVLQQLGSEAVCLVPLLRSISQSVGVLKHLQVLADATAGGGFAADSRCHGSLPLDATSGARCRSQQCGKQSGSAACRAAAFSTSSRKLCGEIAVTQQTRRSSWSVQEATRSGGAQKSRMQTQANNRLNGRHAHNKGSVTRKVV